jgi:hypothetical protein
MKNNKSKVVLILLILLAAFSMTACEDADEELMEKAFLAWLGGEIDGGKAEDIANHVIQKVIRQTVQEVTNTDESVQLAGLDVIEQIEIADNMSERALEDLDTARMAKAVNMRPDDWRLQEKDGAVWVANGNAAAAQTAFMKSDDLLRNSLQHGGHCPTLRMQQLQTRRQTLQQAAVTCKTDYSCQSDEEFALQTEIAEVDVLLQKADATGIPAFCEGITW